MQEGEKAVVAPAASTLLSHHFCLHTKSTVVMPSAALSIDVTVYRRTLSRKAGKQAQRD